MRRRNAAPNAGRGDWIIGYRGELVSVPPSKGLSDIAVLISHPGRPIHVFDLTKDSAALAACRERFVDVDRELDELHARGDTLTATRANEKRERLHETLVAAYGGDGDSATRAEVVRARAAVTMRLRDTLRRLDEGHPALARHLSRAVRTGTFCRYEPDMTPMDRRDDNVFRCEGDFWTLRFAGKTVRLKDSRGLRDIAALLSRPHESLHASELIVLGVAASPAARSSAAAGGEALTISHSPDLTAGDRIDPRARREYRARLAELDAELARVTAAGDTLAAERARRERGAIAAELAAVCGRAGRLRPNGDSRERARIAVAMRIRNALRRVSEMHPELARHLASAIRTGRQCQYDPARSIEWSVTDTLDRRADLTSSHEN